MERLQEIETRISELRDELGRVEGTPTEVYTRIVGYYRSLKNWNRGKREEYGHRVTFRPDLTVGAPRAGARPVRADEPTPVRPRSPAAVQTPPDASAARLGASDGERSGGIRSYTYFYRQHCPNCPPVRSFMERLPLSGRMVDVDSSDGMAQAVSHQVLSTPTVILMDRDGREVAQAGSIEALRSILESAG